MALESGARLGPYEIQSLLGAGGMGEVYRGRDTRLGREVALKVISAARVQDPALRGRFELEARAASSLNHPSIVTIYDVGETDGVSWIAMEWVDGHTLREALAGGPLSLREALPIAARVADGLAAAHAKGIVHRDLKPENVMVTADGHAKILDFGLARLGAGEQTPGADSQVQTLEQRDGLTRAGTILGTVGYMSPEQAAGRTVTSSSDQFSFGLILYEMLSGRRAFALPTAVETLAAIIRDQPPPLASVRPGLPAALLRVVATCLEKAPERRFASTRDLAFALASIATTSAVDAAAYPASAPTGATAVLTPTPARRARPFARTAVVAAALAVLALAVGVRAWLRLQRTTPVESLAILPFENAGKDPDADYLSDGLTESLIDRMSRIPSLRVMARSTVFRLRGAPDAREAGRRLGVGAVVTGSVARRGERIAISAELVDVSTGARLWGGRFDRPFAELLRVQDSLATEIADGLRLTLSGEQRQILARHGTESAEAYELVLKARALLARENKEDDLEARRLAVQALEVDPAFLDARLTVVATYARAATNGWAPPAEAWRLAAAEIEKARTLAPGDARVRCALANRRFLLDWDWAAAEKEFRELEGDATLLLGETFRAICMFYWARGETQRGIALLERALRADPANLESRIMLADFLSHAGRLDEAASRYETIAAAEPAEAAPLLGLAELRRLRGDVPGAVEALRRAYERTGDDAGAKALALVRSESQYDAVEVAEARARLEEALADARRQYVSPLELARLWARVGDKAKALESLDAALAERSPGLVFLKAERAWDPVRADPRFAAVVRSVGIP